MPVLPSNLDEFQRISAQYAQGAATFALATAKLGQAERQFQERLKLERDNFELERQKFSAQQDLQKLRIDTMKVELDAFKRREAEATEVQAGVRSFMESGPYVRYHQALVEGSPQEQEVARNELLGAITGQLPAVQEQLLGAEMARAKVAIFPRQAAAEYQKLLSEAASKGAGISSEQFKMAQQISQAAGETIRADVEAAETSVNAELSSIEEQLRKRAGTIQTGGITAGVLSGMTTVTPDLAMFNTREFMRAVSANLNTIDDETIRSAAQDYIKLSNQAVALLQQKQLVQMERATADRVVAQFRFAAYTEPGISLSDMVAESGRAAQDIKQLRPTFNQLLNVPAVKDMVESPTEPSRAVFEDTLRRNAPDLLTGKPWRRALEGSLYDMLLATQRVRQRQRTAQQESAGGGTGAFGVKGQ